MRSTREPRWWDGPWPWLIYLFTYGIPWIWVAPSLAQLMLSVFILAAFLPVYLVSFRLRERKLLVAVIVMTAIGLTAVPVDGGWTALTIYPTMQAARIRPRKTAIIVIIATIAAFIVAGLISGRPLAWWLPSMILPTLLGGAALSREVFYERTYALFATQEEVRRLAGLAERERMARDLHDTIGRTLTLVALKADLISRLAYRDTNAACSEAQLIAAEARTGLQQVSAALNGQIGGSLKNEISVSLEVLTAAGIIAHAQGDATRVPSDVGALLAMTLREAVTNVIRHAGATRCAIQVDVDSACVRLTVADDGIGGPVEDGNGLTGMRQRLFAAGARVSVVQRSPGLAVVAAVPL